MTDSWKIGAVAGLIAGLIAGVVAIIFQDIAFIIGLPYAMIFTSPTNFALVHILMGLIWGGIFGIIYSKGYRLIPGEGLSKSLFFGMLVFLITNFREGTFYLGYWPVYNLLSYSWIFIGIFMWIAYGLMLGFLYETLHVEYSISKEKEKIVTYNMSSGLYSGAFAGLIGGIAALLSRILGAFLGLFELTVTWFSEGRWLVITPTPFTFLAGVHLLVNMIWGIVLGLLYPLVYNLIPGKGVTKGLCYGLLFFLVASFRLGIYYLAWGEVMGLVWSWGFIGFFNALFFGLVLGLLYRKPTETSAVKKEDIQTVKMVKCIHCNASILRNSEYCNKCGKKQ